MTVDSSQEGHFCENSFLKEGQRMLSQKRFLTTIWFFDAWCKRERLQHTLSLKKIHFKLKINLQRSYRFYFQSRIFPQPNADFYLTTVILKLRIFYK